MSVLCSGKCGIAIPGIISSRKLSSSDPSALLCIGDIDLQLRLCCYGINRLCTLLVVVALCSGHSTVCVAVWSTCRESLIVYSEFIVGKMDSMVGQLGVELVKSGIALAIQSIGRSFAIVIIHLPIVEGVDYKRDLVVRMDSGSIAVINLTVIKALPAGFLASGFQQDHDLILVALSLACSQSCLLLIARSASSVPSPVLLRILQFPSIACLQKLDALIQFGTVLGTISTSNQYTLDLLLKTVAFSLELLGTLVLRSMSVFIVAVCTVAAVSFPDLRELGQMRASVVLVDYYVSVVS
ncbi:MAG: hypothetical protein EZS28_000969 [Streblomastix strix]|uniref:Uncharacterized protein n=1 Tax=Streblomastix strix TaxID=222440 RepID=A0A5J4X8L8_9EUKA|nr:MAG: hypothetical protein EZS28_000969 [Streblomastix strix]